MGEIKSKDTSEVRNKNLDNWKTIKSEENMKENKAFQIIQDKLYNSEMKNKDVKADKYYSTYSERIEHCPQKNSENGYFEGDRGESKYVPHSKEVQNELKKYNQDGIEYKNGVADFSKVSEAKVRISHMTSDRNNNFRQCDNTLAKQFNAQRKEGKTNWTPRDIKEYRKEHQLSWHEHNDGKTCYLVSQVIHTSCPHLGGVSECKKRDKQQNGGGFDA